MKHPLLQAKKRLDQNFVHVSSQKRKPKKEPKDDKVVNIDGEKKPWSQFKRKWAEELDRRAGQGESVRNAQFVLNMNSPNEKLLEWNYRSGFRSEDSDDEMTVYKRSERQYYRNLRKDFGQDSTLL